MLLVQLLSSFEVPFENGSHQNLVLFAFAFNHCSVSGRDVAIAFGLIKQTAACEDHALLRACTHHGAVKTSMQCTPLGVQNNRAFGQSAFKFL